MNRNDWILVSALAVAGSVLVLALAAMTQNSGDLASWAQAVGTLLAAGSVIWLAQRERQDVFVERDARARLLSFQIAPRVETLMFELMSVRHFCSGSDFEASVAGPLFKPGYIVALLSVELDLTPSQLDGAWVFPARIGLALGQLVVAVASHARILERVPELPMMSILDRMMFRREVERSLDTIGDTAGVVLAYCAPFASDVRRDAPGHRS